MNRKANFSALRYDLLFIGMIMCPRARQQSGLQRTES